MALGRVRLASLEESNHVLPVLAGVRAKQLDIIWESSANVSPFPHLLIGSVISQVSVASCIFILCFAI